MKLRRKRPVHNARPKGNRSGGRGRKLLRIDPTRTITLRRAFSAKVRRAFGRLKAALLQLVDKEDSFGLTQNAEGMAVNASWEFLADPAKVEAFQRWLRQQFASLIAGRSMEQLWQAYVEVGFKKGAGRAFDDTKVAMRAQSYGGGDPLELYQGTKEEFLRSSFGRPVAQEKVQLLAGRAFDDLEGVTEVMSTRMSRVLTDGLVAGKGPREVARDLADEVDIGSARAETIARTELIRAHAEGQLEALDQLGVEEVGVAVEWTVTDDEKLCDECAPMEGVVLTIDEARGMIPRHPNCRCAWIPANVGESGEGQKDTRSTITGAISESRGGNGDDWGSGQAIAKHRPESILGNELRVLSEFLVNSNERKEQ